MECEMEAGEIRPDNFDDAAMGKMSSCCANASNEEEHIDNPRLESPPEKKIKLDPLIISPENNATPSVSNCYVFKSRLQEYAQRAGLSIPVYETIKEGPSHEPFFRSTVVLDNVRYDSLPGFFNRKAAEQSAAEVALVELSKSAETKFGISAPVHETGLCKNLLQEYAQKMNYAVPWYECVKDGNQSKNPTYSCTVEIGGTKYVGASSGTKKEAEIKAARTALLAIQSASSEERNGNSVYTVIPQKRRSSNPEISTKETAAAPKPKKQPRKKTRPALRKQKHSSGQGTTNGGLKADSCCQDATESISGDASCVQQNTTDEMKVQMAGQGGIGMGIIDGVEQNTADGMEVGTTDGVGSQEKPADGSEVKIKSSSGTETGVTKLVSLQREDCELDPVETKTSYGVSSQGKAADGSEVNTYSWAVAEQGMTNFVSLQKEDSELDPIETKTTDGVSSQEKVADGSEVKSDSQSVAEPSASNFAGLQNTETNTSDGVGSQEKAADGSDFKTDSLFSVAEPSMTNFVGLRGEDSVRHSV